MLYNLQLPKPDFKVKVKKAFSITNSEKKNRHLANWKIVFFS